MALVGVKGLEVWSQRPSCLPLFLCRANSPHSHQRSRQPALALTRWASLNKGLCNALWIITVMNYISVQMLDTTKIIDAIFITEPVNSLSSYLIRFPLPSSAVTLWAGLQNPNAILEGALATWRGAKGYACDDAYLQCYAPHRLKSLDWITTLPPVTLQAPWQTISCGI